MICYFHLSKFPIESLVSGLEPEQEVSSNGEDMAAENQSLGLLPRVIHVCMTTLTSAMLGADC